MEKIELFERAPGIEVKSSKQDVPLQYNKCKNLWEENKPVINGFQETHKNEIKATEVLNLDLGKCTLFLVFPLFTSYFLSTVPNKY